LNGNPRAEEILYEKYKKCVKNFLKKQYSSFYDLEDDVSEIMIKVFIGLKSYNGSKSKFRSWVFSIAKNHMIDKWRNNISTTISNQTINYTITYDFNLNNSFYDISNSERNIFNGASSIVSSNTADFEFENCNSITHISTQLTPQDFTLLNMKYIQGYNYDEIGSEFNVTSSTISNRVNYIKTKLKKNNPEITYG